MGPASMVFRNVKLFRDRIPETIANKQNTLKAEIPMPRPMFLLKIKLPPMDPIVTPATKSKNFIWETSFLPRIRAQASKLTNTTADLMPIS
ncbi:hypothetical protein D3C81_1950710 [compost metagenome]